MINKKGETTMLNFNDYIEIVTIIGFIIYVYKKYRRPNYHSKFKKYNNQKNIHTNKLPQTPHEKRQEYIESIWEEMKK